MLDEQQLAELLMTLASTAPIELDCEECHAKIAEYTECELLGRTPDEALSQVKQHLAVCADCREEFAALLAAVGRLV